AGGRGLRDRRVHAPGRERVADGRGRAAVEGERDDPAAIRADVPHGRAGDGSQALPQQPGQRVDAGLDRGQAPAERVVDGHAEADLRGHVALPVLEPPGVGADLVAVRGGPGGRAGKGGASRSSTSRRTYRKPVPRGPRRYLRPVAESMSHCSSRTSSGRWPADWHASRRKSAPAARARRPTSAAGFTRPPFVGTWVMATSLTRPSRRSACSTAVTELSPEGSLGTTSISAPVRRATCRKAM